MSEDKLIVKSPYTYSQIGDFVSVKQYMFVRTSGKKCVLLRFANEADFAVDSFEFILVQIDSKGEIIDRTKVSCEGLNFGAGDVYAMKKGIIVSEKCVDLRVQMILARSGKYRYTVSGGRRVVAHYDIEERWKYFSDAELMQLTEGEEDLQAHPKEKHSRGLIGFIVVVAVLAILLVNGIPYIGALGEYMQRSDSTAMYGSEAPQALNTIFGEEYVKI